MLVDVHCHLDLLENVEAVVARAEKVGIKGIIAAGINPETNRTVVDLAKKFPSVKASLGIYPEKLDSIDIEKEIAYIKKQDIVAIGEVGLDGTLPNVKKQEEVFVQMISLAKELDKPLLVHSRKAEARVLALLEEHKAKNVILHCFCGKKSLVKQASTLGYYFSIPANVGRSSGFQMIVKEISMNFLLTETDSPFLSPTEGKNEPANVKEAIPVIAKLKGFEEAEVKKNIYLNYQRLF